MNRLTDNDADGDDDSDGDADSDDEDDQLASIGMRVDEEWKAKSGELFDVSGPDLNWTRPDDMEHDLDYWTNSDSADTTDAWTMTDTD